MPPTNAMTSRERILAAIDREPVDRIPTDIWATGEVMRQLVDHFGDRAQVFEQLNIDRLVWVFPRYTGPCPAVPAGERVDHWGIRTKAMDYGEGIYQEQSHCPLAHVTRPAELDDCHWPDADLFDYKRVRENLLELRRHHAVMCGYMPPLYLYNGMRGLEQSLMDPLEDPELCTAIVTRISDCLIEHHRRLFETCDGLIDVAQVTDDLGAQAGPMISLATYREFFKPHHQRMIDLCKAFGIRVMHHDDGAMAGFLPDLVEMGIDLLNPVQWRCPGMDPEGLKRAWGDRISFHGGLDNQETLPRGDTAAVRAETRWLIDTLASDGTGYVFAPCHNIQPGTPIENIVAMYDEAHRYGRFDVA